MKLKILFFCLIFCNLFFAQNQWETLNPKPSFGNNKAIIFSNNIGYTINNSKELLSTDDQGKTWKIKQSVTSANDIKFASNVGYIIGDNGYVLKSSDSGGTWSVVNIGSSENLNSVNIFSDKIIISSSTKFYSSADGINWNSSLYNIPNPSISKAVFTSNSEGHIYSLGKIYKTTDGGITWINTFTYSSTPNDLNLLYFKNRNEGYINFGHSNFYKTIDAGQSWSLVSGKFSYAIKSVYFTDQNSGFAVGEYGNIYKTIDNGVSWTNYPESYFANNEKDLNSVFFTSQNEGFAVGNNGIILKTMDSGISWVKYSFSYDSISKLQLVNGFYYLQGGNDIYKSADKIAWQKLTSPIVPNLYYNLIDFQVINDSKIYSLVGTGGSSYFAKSNDNGKSWTVLENSNAGASVLQFLNENIGYRTGSAMYKTTDGGLTWATISGPYMHDVHFINENIAFGIKDNKLYKTSDSGQNWNIISGTEYVSNYQFLNENDGLVVANYSLLKTRDGGVTFEKSFTNKNYQYINFENTNIGFLSGQYSDDHSYTDNGGATWKSLSKPFIDISRYVVNKDFYIGGTYGKFAKTAINYDNVYLQLKVTTVISAQKASVSGYGSVNQGQLENITFQYSKDNTFSTALSADSSAPAIVEGKNSNLNATLDFLSPATDYFVRIKGTNAGNVFYSNVVQFKTKDAFTLNLIFNKIKSQSVILQSSVKSNDDKGVQNIKIIYGTDVNNLTSTADVNPNSVAGNDLQIAATPLQNLLKNTTYYLKIKLTYNGAENLSKIYSFKTLDGPALFLSPYDISTQKFSGYVQSDEKVDNIAFQYGNQNFENNIVSNPAAIEEASQAYLSSVNSPVLNLNQNYYIRIKGDYNNSKIYSNVEIYNPFSAVVLAKNNEQIMSSNSVKINGFINTNGYTATNLKIFYGLSADTLNDSVMLNPNSVTNYETETITGQISGLDFNKTYYYRFAAQNNTAKLVDYKSEIYSFSLSQLQTGENNLSQFSIYPNPVSEYFTIENSQQIKAVQLRDLSGRIVKEFKNFPGKAENNFDIKNLKTGIYLVTVELKNGKIVSSKIIKK